MAAVNYTLNLDIITDALPHVSRVRGSDGVTLDLDYDGRNHPRADGVHVPEDKVIEVDDTDARVMEAIASAILYHNRQGYPVLVPAPAGTPDFVLRTLLEANAP